MNPKSSDYTDHGNVIGAALEANLELTKIWGNAPLGLILVSAYFSATSYSTEQLSDLTGISPETVRRHLKPLINIDRVRVFKEGRRVTYKAHQEWAVKTRDQLNELVDRVRRDRARSNDNNIGTMVSLNRLVREANRR